LKANHACCSYEDAEDIPVLETDVLGNPTYDEEVISNTGQEQTTCDEYPNEDDEEQSSPMVLVYYDCEYDPWESHEGEKEGKPNEQFISCPELVSEQPPPGISQPASASHPPMLTGDIQPCVSSGGADRAICYKFSKVFHLFYEPVSKYMELHFLHALDMPNFISTSAFIGKMKDVIVLLS